MQLEFRRLQRLLGAALVGGAASLALTLSGCGGSDAPPASAAAASSDRKLDPAEHAQTSPNYMFNLWTFGSGTVTSSPAGLKCTNEHCYSYFLIGSTVTLTATPAAGAAISQWGGSCAGKTTTCKIVMNYPKDVSTNFTTVASASPGATTPPAGTSSAPVVLFTDIQSGPISGGENNDGVYLSIFGRNFGTSLSNLNVSIGGQPVARIMSLGSSRVAASTADMNLEKIVVQVGAIGNPKMNGTALPIDVAVSGVHSNDSVGFIPNPGTIYFVDNSVGVDTTDTSTGGEIAHPFRTVQRPNVGNSTPIQPASEAGALGRANPGDVIVMRHGTGSWTDIGFNNTFVTFQNKSGSAPTGAVGTGPITLMGYPGEDVFIDSVYNPSVYGGAISSADTARQEAGKGAWLTISNLRVEGGREQGAINAQAGTINPNGSHWRVVNNELTAKTAITNSNAKAAGIAGSGAGEVWLANLIHDVYCGPDNGSSPLQNHGIYVEGDGDYVIAYNYIYNIFGGNGIQAYNNGSNGSDPNINDLSIHHNLIHDVRKHLLNIADGTEKNVAIWDNVLYNSSYGGIRFNTTNLTGAKIWNNVIYNNNTRANGNYGPLTNDASLSAGALDVRNNIFAPYPGTPYLSGAVGISGSVATLTNNLWYGGTGSFAADPHAVNQKPSFTNVSAGLFSLQQGSPGVDVGTSTVSSLVTNDFLGDARPLGAAYDIGAYER